METNRFSPDELIVLRTLFDSSDRDGTGYIHLSQLAELLTKLGKSTDEINTITEAASGVAYENEGQLNFENFYTILERVDSAINTPFEGPDPKVIEFLRILEEYRVKCEEEGNYLEAGRAHKQLGTLRKQEEKRQQKAVKSRQISERQDVQMAHNMQFNDFDLAWESYMEEYDNMAQSYIQQMTGRHAMVLLEFQKQLRHELLSKPPKWSRELLDMRRKQHNCARGKAYAEAEKLKKLCDKIEESERREMESGQAVNFAKKEAKYRLHQQAELHTLLKRIECRRKEHVKQRNLDSKRLLQRNRNVQAVLESKQLVESQRIFLDIKKNLINNALIIQSSAYQPYNSRNITSSKYGSGVGVSQKSMKRSDKISGKHSTDSTADSGMSEYENPLYYPRDDENRRGHGNGMDYRGDSSAKTYEGDEGEENSSDNGDAAAEIENENETEEYHEAGNEEEEGEEEEGEVGVKEQDEYADDIEGDNVGEGGHEEQKEYSYENPTEPVRSDKVSDKPFESFFKAAGPSYTITA